MTLSREGLICGPSSGMALRGLHAFLADKQAAGRLQDLADPVTSEVACAFLCCDLPYQYLDTYFQKADPRSSIQTGITTSSTLTKAHATHYGS